VDKKGKTSPKASEGKREYQKKQRACLREEKRVELARGGKVKTLCGLKTALHIIINKSSLMVESALPRGDVRKHTLERKEVGKQRSNRREAGEKERVAFFERRLLLLV